MKSNFSYNVIKAHGGFVELFPQEHHNHERVHHQAWRDRAQASNTVIRLNDFVCPLDILFSAAGIHVYTNTARNLNLQKLNAVPFGTFLDLMP